MNGFSKAFLVGAGVFSLGIAQPAFAQNWIPESTFVNFMKYAKSATFENSDGVRIVLMKYEDRGSRIFATFVMEGYTVITSQYAEINGVSRGFAASIANPITNKPNNVTGKGGKISSYVGVKTLAQAKDIYAVAICTPFELLGDVTNPTWAVEQHLSDSELVDMAKVFSPEYEIYLPRFKGILKSSSPKVLPQKYSAPKKEGEPTYRSANYRESVRNIQTAMKAKEIRKPDTKKPFRVRDRLMARA